MDVVFVEGVSSSDSKFKQSPKATMVYACWLCTFHICTTVIMTTKRNILTTHKSPLCDLTRITWKLKVIYERSAYQHSLHGAELHERLNWRAMAPDTLRVCKLQARVYIVIWLATTIDNKPLYIMTPHYTSNDTLNYCQWCIAFKQQSRLTTLQVT